MASRNHAHSPRFRSKPFGARRDAAKITLCKNPGAHGSLYVSTCVPKGVNVWSMQPNFRSISTSRRRNSGHTIVSTRSISNGKKNLLQGGSPFDDDFSVLALGSLRGTNTPRSTARNTRGACPCSTNEHVRARAPHHDTSTWRLRAPRG